MNIQRVEQYTIKKSNKYYLVLNDFCLKSKNLYNHANYLVRQSFINSGEWLRYQDLDKLLKSDKEFPDYKNMPVAQSAQQTLRMLDKNWKSFFKSIKDWNKNKDKYLGRPKLPKYKAKDSKYILIVTNQSINIVGDYIIFPRPFQGFTLSPKCIYRSDFKSIQQVRFIPKVNNIVAEVVYNVEIPCEIKKDNGRYLSIDFGIDNLAAVTNNFGKCPLLINGKGLKSINQYYNKKTAYYHKVAKQMNNLHSSNRLQKLTSKRNSKIKDYMHKASRYIVNHAEANDVCTIVIGHNQGWKQECELGRRNNQNFIQIPFNTLIEQIQYKAQEFGIQVILTEESYTSGTSFLDNEMPTKENYNKSRRIHRGLFRSNLGTWINADVNGAYQIMKKVFPKVNSEGIEVAVSLPIKVNLA